MQVVDERVGDAVHAANAAVDCLASGLHATPAELLTKGTAAFCRDVAKCTEAELRAFEDSGDHLKFFAAAAAV